MITQLLCYFITEPSRLYYLALSFFGCNPRIYWGWHMSPAHGDLTLCSFLTHLYMSGHTPRKQNIIGNTISPALERSYCGSFSVIYSATPMQKAQLKPEMQINGIQQCPYSASWVRLHIRSKQTQKTYVAVSFIKMHFLLYTFCNVMETLSKEAIGGWSQTQTEVENTIYYPEVCLSGLAGENHIPRINRQHMLRD